MRHFGAQEKDYRKNKIARTRILEIMSSRESVRIKDLIQAFKGDSVSLDRALSLLENEGKVAIEDSFKPRTLSSFVFSLYNLHFWVVTVLVLAAVLSIYTVPQSMPFLEIRFMLGALFVLFLPGYSMVKALFTSKGLDRVEQLGLSIGLSLAIMALVGLFLNYSPWGLTLSPLVVSLAFLTLLFALFPTIDKLANPA